MLIKSTGIEGLLCCRERRRAAHSLMYPFVTGTTIRYLPGMSGFLVDFGTVLTGEP
jgi:hypothetical protein